jgi:hypothetical protein
MQLAPIESTCKRSSCGACVNPKLGSPSFLLELKGHILQPLVASPVYLSGQPAVRACVVLAAFQQVVCLEPRHALKNTKAFTNSPQGLAAAAAVPRTWPVNRLSEPVVGLLGSLVAPAGHSAQLKVAPFQ